MSEPVRLEADHVLEPGRCTYYLDSIHFTDDPRLDAEASAVDGTPRGGSGLSSPERDGTGRWIIERDIVLGLGVPGYQRCVGAGLQRFEESVLGPG